MVKRGHLATFKCPQRTFHFKGKENRTNPLQKGPMVAHLRGLYRNQSDIGLSVSLHPAKKGLGHVNCKPRVYNWKRTSASFEYLNKF